MTVRQSVGLIVLACALTGCSQRITSIDLLARPIMIGPEWIEIQLPPKVIAEWRFQIIRETVETPHSDELNPAGLEMHDGSIAIQTVEFVRASGTKDVFSFDGFVNRDIDFSNLKVSQGTHFIAVRLRCSMPLMISRMIFMSYMPEDTKTGVP